MLKVIIRKKGRRSSDSEWNSERVSMRALSSEKESHAFRETKAANIPVTYVSDGVIYREQNGERVVLGEVAPKVKVKLFGVLPRMGG